MFFSRWVVPTLHMLRMKMGGHGMFLSDVINNMVSTTFLAVCIIAHIYHQDVILDKFMTKSFVI